MRTMKKSNFIFIMLLIIILLLGGYYTKQKSGYHIDEMLTFGLSNSYYEPFLPQPPVDANYGMIISGETFTNYLSVEDDKFSYDSVMYNQANDVHPPLYYFVIHTISSLNKNLPIKTVGYAVNAIFILLTLIAIYDWVQKRFSSQMAICLTLCYGFSTSLFSMFAFFRMYALLTYFTVLLTILVYELYCSSNDEEKCVMQHVEGAVVLFLGALTQYYFLIYAFFISAIYLMILMLEKKWKCVLRYMLSVVGGAGFYILIWGKNAVNHIFYGYRGTETFSKAADIKAYLNIKNYLKIFIEQLFPNKIVAFSICILLLCICILVFYGTLRKRQYVILKQTMLITLPWILYVLVIFVISPFQIDRYIFNIMPCVWLTFFGCLFIIAQELSAKGLISAAVILSGVMAVSTNFIKTPNYVFLENKEISSYLFSLPTETVCIYDYVNSWGTYVNLADILAHFDSTYIVNENSYDWLAEQKIEDVSASVILMLEDDTSLSAVLEATGYRNAEEIGYYQIAHIYLLTK